MPIIQANPTLISNNSYGMANPAIPIQSMPFDEEDNDFYMDDNIREIAEKLLKNTKQAKAQRKVEAIQNNELKAIDSTEEHEEAKVEIQLQDIDYEDLHSIVSSYSDDSQQIDENYTLSIDCETPGILEVLADKMLPHLNSITLSNVEKNYELASKFLYIPHFSTVNSIILNEYSTAKINLEYFILSLHNLFVRGVILNSLTIREVEMTSDIFNMLMNSA